MGILNKNTFIFCLIFFSLSLQNVFSQDYSFEDFLSGWKIENTDMINSISDSNQEINSFILNALKDIPRHDFINPSYRKLAYKNISLPGLNGGILPSPEDCIKIIEMLSPSANDKVLIAGTNCGYTAAIISKIVSGVYLIEETDSLDVYMELFKKNKITNIHVSESLDVNSFKDIPVFDKILIHGAVAVLSESITERLAIKGNITFVLSETGNFQQLVSMRRSLLGDSIICGGSCYFPEISKIKISN